MCDEPNCLGGALWPIATDGNTDHMWVERHDECNAHANDEDAAAHLASLLGMEVKHAYIPSIRRDAPYIDVVQK